MNEAVAHGAAEISTSSPSSRSTRFFLGGLGILLAASAPVLWGYSSKNARILQRYSIPYAATLFAYFAALIACLVFAALPSSLGGRFHDRFLKSVRAIFKRGWSLAIFIICVWAGSVLVLLSFANIALGHSVVLHLSCFAAVLWTSTGLIVLSRPDTPALARALAKYAICLVLAITVFFTGEVVLRKNPGLLPPRLIFELPGRGDFLHSEYVFEKPISIGYRYRPNVVVSDRLMASQANLYTQQPALIRPIPKGQDRVLIEMTFTTDENGYRNTSPLRDTYPIAVSGDSFTSLVVEPRPWPAVTSEKLGVPVLNLGMQGYSPQSETQALISFGLPRKPKWLVLAYFEGNDLIDSYYYEAKKRSGLGWTEYDFAQCGLLERSLGIQAFTYALRSVLPGRRSGPGLSRPGKDYPFPFQVELNGRTVEMSLSISYLSRLALSCDEVKSMNSFPPVIAAIKDLESKAMAASAKVLVVFCPTKEHCYIPYLPPALLAEKISGIKRSTVDQEGMLVLSDAPLLAGDILQNLDGQRDAIVKRLQSEQISVLDLTGAFQEAARSGEALYLTNDTHWSSAGNELAGSAIAEELKKGM